MIHRCNDFFNVHEKNTGEKNMPKRNPTNRITVIRHYHVFTVSPLPVKKIGEGRVWEKSSTQGSLKILMC